MAFIKPIILLAMTTALTACATSYKADSSITESKIDSSTATVKMANGFKYPRRGDYGNWVTPFYMICENECKIRKSHKFAVPKSMKVIPRQPNKIEGRRVTANELVVVIAGLEYPPGGVRDFVELCTHKLAVSYTHLTLPTKA